MQKFTYTNQDGSTVILDKEPKKIGDFIIEMKELDKIAMQNKIAEREILKNKTLTF